VLNLAYRYERFVLVQQLVQGVAQPFQQGFDQVEFSGAWPIRRQWNVFTRDVYSLRDHTPLERSPASSTVRAAGGSGWAHAGS